MWNFSSRSGRYLLWFAFSSKSDLPAPHRPLRYWPVQGYQGWKKIYFWNWKLEALKISWTFKPELRAQHSCHGLMSRPWKSWKVIFLCNLEDYNSKTLAALMVMWPRNKHLHRPGWHQESLEKGWPPDYLSRMATPHQREACRQQLQQTWQYTITLYIVHEYIAILTNLL